VVQLNAGDGLFDLAHDFVVTFFVGGRRAVVVGDLAGHELFDIVDTIRRLFVVVVGRDIGFHSVGGVSTGLIAVAGITIFGLIDIAGMGALLVAASFFVATTAVAVAVAFGPFRVALRVVVRSLRPVAPFTI